MASRSLSCCAVLLVLVSCTPGPKREGGTEGAYVLDCLSTFPPDLGAQALVARYGAENVSTDSVALGDTEGEMVPATFLFAADSARRVEITWHDRENRLSPRHVRVKGTFSRWRAPSGVTLGTSLADLEQLNGQSFEMAGFAFDGSGTVTSWQGGHLEEASDDACRLMLSLDPGAVSGERARLYKQVQGDRIFPSSHPAMRALNPRVVSMMLTRR